MLLDWDFAVGNILGCNHKIRLCSCVADHNLAVVDVAVENRQKKYFFNFFIDKNLGV